MEQWETQVLPLLPASLAKELQAGELAGAEEIRIRVNRPVQVLGKNNRLLQWTPTPAMCQEVLLRLCRQSIYAYGPELAVCYMTLPGGVRVGLAGRMAGVGEEARLVTATGFNIRLARAIPGCADPLMGMLLGPGGLRSTLLLSAPGAGKTTMLRDAARQLSLQGDEGMSGGRTAGDWPGATTGCLRLDVGPCTDVLEGCKKARAMSLLVRGMGPEVLVTDELAGQGDADAVMEAAGCGVRILASAHGDGWEDLKRRKSMFPLIQNGCFTQVILLRRQAGQPPRLETVYRAKEEPCG